MGGTYCELRGLSQSNDEDLEFTVKVKVGGAVVDLGTVSALELFLKPSATTADADPSVTKLTLAAGDIAIIDGSAGVCLARVPAAALAAAGARWWRLDAVISGKRKTAMYGPLHISDT